MIGSPQSFTNNQWSQGRLQTMVFNLNGGGFGMASGVEMRLQGDVYIESVIVNYANIYNQGLVANLNGQVFSNQVLRLRELLGLDGRFQGRVIHSLTVEARDANFNFGSGSISLLINGAVVGTSTLDGSHDGNGCNRAITFRINQPLGINYGNGIQTLQLSINGSARIGIIRARLAN